MTSTSLSVSEPTTPKADILVVDDMPDNIRFLSQMLVDQGYSVRKAISAEMATTAVLTVPPDLILLDVMMPDVDGYEFCRSLKSNPLTAAIPVIFLSALDTVFNKVKAFESGGVDYVTKPFQFEEILARIETQLALRSLQAQLEQQNTQLRQTVTALKMAEAQLIQKEKMIGLGQFVSGVAHEINNPISFISGNLKPAREYVAELLNLLALYQAEFPQGSDRLQQALAMADLEFLKTDLNKLLQSMEKGVDRIQVVIRALRTFSRLDEAAYKAIDLPENLESVIFLLQHRLQASAAHPEIQLYRCYEPLPPVFCYASLLNQVFLNLLNNAIDAVIQAHLSLGRTDLRIQVSTQVNPSQYAKITIQDNGIGIPEDIRSRLFDPFFTTKPIGQGTGLGLSTSYQIITKDHGGTLNYESIAGKGTTFTISIPLGKQK